MTVGTFHNFIWTDAEFQCGSNGNLHFATHALVLAQFAFYFGKAGDENKNTCIQLLNRHVYTLIDMHSLFIGLYSITMGQYTLVYISIQPYNTCIDQP